MKTVFASRAYGDFFALLGYLERAASPDEAPIGALADVPARVHLRHDAGLSFPTADVSCASQGPQSEPNPDHPGNWAIVTSAFLGLTGSTTPLPEHLIEGWSQQLDDSTSGLHALFDVWHHRLLGLLYRSVVKYSPSQSARQDGQDAWTKRLCAWTPDSDDLPLDFRLRITPLARHRAPSGAHLLSMIQDLCRDAIDASRVRIEALSGGWQPLSGTQWMRLGHNNARLGHDAIVGHSLASPASAFAVHLGPLDAQSYAFVRTPTFKVQLARLLAWFTPAAVQAQVLLVLQPDAYPSWPACGGQLGADTWLGRPKHNTTFELALKSMENT